jgi:hypothetical protein
MIMDGGTAALSLLCLVDAIVSDDRSTHPVLARVS